MKKKKVVLISLLSLASGWLVIQIVALVLALPRAQAGEDATLMEAQQKAGAAGLEKENALLRRKLQALAPKGTHVVVDSARNVLYLRKGDEVILQAVISCGSGSILEEPGGERKWIFDTPRGEFQVKSKIVDPTWVKPDWAFIEEGKDVPKNPGERLEAGVLGDYALGFGEGYFIHGTLYTRLLGRSVTHGCIRVGDKDLKALYQAASIGTKIYVY
jgi:lipoprotein-anchoring transpeptidase ErfK/SrfK